MQQTTVQLLLSKAFLKAAGIFMKQPMLLLLLLQLLLLQPLQLLQLPRAAAVVSRAAACPWSLHLQRLGGLFLLQRLLQWRARNQALLLRLLLLLLVQPLLLLLLLPLLLS